MKANEAPKKIYIHKSQYWGLMANEDNITENGIEYARTDAIIKKAEEAFCKATCNGHPPRSSCISVGTCKKYDNFVKFMKGE